MKISSMFSGSKYLKAADLNGGDKVVTIDRVVEEEVGLEKERKPVCYFSGLQKGFVLNKTNSDRLAHKLGDETAPPAPASQYFRQRFRKNHGNPTVSGR